MQFVHSRDCDPDLMTDSFVCECGARVSSLFGHEEWCRGVSLRHCISCGHSWPIGTVLFTDLDEAE